MDKMKNTLSVLDQNRGFVVGLMIVVVVIVLVSFQVGHGAGVASVSDTTDNTSDIVFQEDEAEVAATPSEEPRDPVKLSGTGQTATDPVQLISGLATVSMKHTGESHFSIWVLDQSGDKVELLVNETGSFEGSKAFQIPSSGKYVLDVSADGPWKVTIKQ